MNSASSTFSMISVAAMLSVPGLVLAQTAPPDAVPRTPTPAAPNTATPNVVAPPARSGLSGTTEAGTATPDTRPNATYTTAEQQLRASKMIGASVYNDQNQKIGSIDDLLITGDKSVDGAIVSVGGFLGIDSKLVKVSYSQIQVRDDRLVISGATKDQLTQLPRYSYTNAAS